MTIHWFVQVVRMLLNVPTYTEYLDRNSQINLQFISGTEVELLEPKILFGKFPPNVIVGSVLYGVRDSQKTIMSAGNICWVTKDCNTISSYKCKINGLRKGTSPKMNN